MPMFPKEPTDAIKLADWLELEALNARDRNASYGDLERALRRAAISDLEDDEEIERKIAEVDYELRRRLESAENAYPFVIDGTVITAPTKYPQRFVPYMFCLCLSYCGGLATAVVRSDFERLSAIAAGNYLSGSSLMFGWPRKAISNEFKKAVAHLCGPTCMGEGGTFRLQPTLSAKDSRVDVVAWRNSPDKLPGKLLLFGACASGNNWLQKLYELNPESFCKKWLEEQPVVNPVKAFFVPHRLEQQRWKHHAWDAGIIFDRCRIAYWALNGKSTVDYSTYLVWVRDVLRHAWE